MEIRILMSVRTIYHSLMFVLFPIGIILIISSAYMFNMDYMFFIFIWVVIFNILLSIIKCPKCKHRIGKAEGTLIDIISYRFYIGKTCDHCGYRFDGTDDIRKEIKN